MIQLNLLAPLYCSQAANRVMQLQEEGGSIINIGSVAVCARAGERRLRRREGGPVERDRGSARWSGDRGCA